MHSKRILTTLLLVLVAGCHDEPPHPSRHTPIVIAKPRAAVASSPEPRRRAAPGWQPARAAAYLDRQAKGWLETRYEVGNVQCALTCHTTFTFMFARPHLEQPSAPLAELSRRIAQPVLATGAWREHTAYYGKPGSSAWRSSLATEAVLSAAALALEDWGAGRAVQATTGAAIDRIWETQNEDGSWSWIDFGLEPWEAGNHAWGTAMAALAVGLAGQGKAPGASSMRRYLRSMYRDEDKRLFDELALVWASMHLDGLLGAAERAEVVERLTAAQHASGGWSTSTLIGRNADQDADGIATGLGAFVLCHTEAAPEAARRAIRWLHGNQGADGAWPARSISTGRSRSNLFMKNAATSFAVLALQRCEAGPPGS